jgi:hypothetical protein
MEFAAYRVAIGDIRIVFDWLFGAPAGPVNEAGERESQALCASSA